jgi:DNA-binding MarR family transcriptional regulator
MYHRIMDDLERLGQAVKRVQHRHHRLMEQRLSATGTTLVQWDALRAVERHPGASAHTLALATFQTDQAFGALASRLESKMLIERTRGRGRTIEHQLTDEGRRALAAGRPLVHEVLSESTASLSAQQRQQLLDLLLLVLGE